MFGTNPIRPPETHDGSVLDVVQIFLTLQGEGHRAGQPAIFIRLGGCNLACDFCDTEFENFQPLSISDIIPQVSHHATANQDNVSKLPLIVITGGEPFRQNIVPLCEGLISKGYTIQIETNGTLWRELPTAVEIVCSPKNTGNGYHPIRADLAHRITSYKFIISATHPHYRDVPDQAYFVNSPNALVFVQPMDEQDAAKNADNLKHAMTLAMQRGFRLSLQMHKLLGIE